MTKKVEYTYTKIEIISLFMLIMLTVMAYIVVSGAYKYNSFMQSITNVLLIMIFGILLTMNVSLIKISRYLSNRKSR